MSYYQDLLKEINDKVAVCWQCRTELSDGEKVTLKRERTIQIHLCYQCYELLLTEERSRG
ncbi:hypothetical protein [Halobacillus mangrovi]|uniref:DUF2197 domain-containing protein n=1 Tax=Halobacillus mangrovi TaxID=402384 RepID=A0A1W5ZS80_9BACI|nr:hypothetical protein [Halobacillus mangrovi]ARI76107.1 hypothetical protein HM131_04320 [Halobacillus mangrovi]